MEPLVIFTILAFMGVGLTLTFAVWRTITRPKAGESFEEAIKTVTSSTEFDEQNVALATGLAKNKHESWSWNRWWLEAAEKTGREPTDSSSTGRAMLIILVVSGFFGVVVFPGGVAGILVPVAILGVIRMWMMIEAGKRASAFEKQLPLLLSSLRSNIHAGVTVQAAFMKIASDLPAPLGDEIRIVRDEVQVSVPFEEALHRMADRVGSRQVQFLVASIGIATRSGSDIVPQLVIIEDIIRQRARINGKIKSAVALAKPTAYLALAAPPLMAIYMLFSQDGYLAYFFGPGLLVGVIAIMFYIAGAVFVRLMVKNVERL